MNEILDAGSGRESLEVIAGVSIEKARSEKEWSGQDARHIQDLMSDSAGALAARTVSGRGVFAALSRWYMKGIFKGGIDLDSGSLYLLRRDGRIAGYGFVKEGTEYGREHPFVFLPHASAEETAQIEDAIRARRER